MRACECGSIGSIKSNVANAVSAIDAVNAVINAVNAVNAVRVINAVNADMCVWMRACVRAGVRCVVEVLFVSEHQAYGCLRSRASRKRASIHRAGNNTQHYEPKVNPLGRERLGRSCTFCGAFAGAC